MSNERKHQEDVRAKEREALLPDIEKFKGYVSRLTTAITGVEEPSFNDERIADVVGTLVWRMNDNIASARNAIKTIADE